MPLLGFGVYQNYNTRPSVLTAFAAGYRFVIDSFQFFQHLVTSNLPVLYRHVDSAQAYKNEAEVGKAVRASGLERADVFISTLRACRSVVHYDP